MTARTDQPSPPPADSGRVACGECCACKRPEPERPTAHSPAQIILGAIWVFLLPLAGMAVGAAVAARAGHALWLLVGVVGGFAGGLAVGQAGRAIYWVLAARRFGLKTEIRI